MTDLEELPGKERRKPDKKNPYKFTLDRIREAVEKFSEEIPKDSVILDFGCGERPYCPLLKDKAKQYVGLDIDVSPETNNSINFSIKEGERLPFKNDYFDVVISTQVLEHIKDLNFYVAELKRVLKKDGYMLITAAFSWDFHPYPRDYWRITKDGYNFLFDGFSEIRFDHDTNSLQTAIQSLNILLGRKYDFKRFTLVMRVINFFISKINYKKGDDKLPGNIFVYLRK